jgi:hypothetical protein
MEIESLKNAGEICVGPVADQRRFPGAAWVASLGAKQTEFLLGDKLEPIYLRETSFVKSPPPRLAT